MHAPRIVYHLPTPIRLYWSCLLNDALLETTFCALQEILALLSVFTLIAIPAEQA